jgi:hypothetical protein
MRIDGLYILSGCLQSGRVAFVFFVEEIGESRFP